MSKAEDTQDLKLWTNELPTANAVIRSADQDAECDLATMVTNGLTQAMGLDEVGRKKLAELMDRPLGSVSQALSGNFDHLTLGFLGRLVAAVDGEFTVMLVPNEAQPDGSGSLGA